MNSTQKKILLVLLLLSGGYFVLFIFPNLTGAKTAAMLSIFEVDEYAQYPHVINMLTPGATPYQTLRNFFVYLHYFYGFPFYLTSALSILPIKLALGERWVAAVPAIMATMRQMVSVLPSLASVSILVLMQTGLRSWWRSIGLWLLLISVPAVTANNLWWHVDGLELLFVVLTIFFLNRDAFHFGRNFLWAAVFCGLAIGTKQLGLFFALAVPIYLLWGVSRRDLTWGRAAGKAALFLLVMVASIIISNPLLMLPQERSEIIKTLLFLDTQASSGVITTSNQTFFAQGYPLDFRIHYGTLGFVLLSLLALIIGLLNPEKRRLSVLILAWTLPLALIITTFATRRTHYWLPVMLPLFSCLVYLFPEGGLFPGWEDHGKAGHWGRRALSLLFGAVIVLQFALFTQTNIQIYTAQLNRETNSPSLAFTGKVVKWMEENRPSEKSVLFRDWRIYLPPNPNWQVEMTWDMPNLDYIRQLNPDVILLDNENLATYSRPDIIEQAANPGNMKIIHEFYQAAQNNRIPGYRRTLADSFGTIFERNP